jgi:hypothetical protein
MDILFGTYRCPDHEPEHFGLHDLPPRTYLGHMLRPLLPRRRTEPTKPVTAVLAATVAEHDS